MKAGGDVSTAARSGTTTGSSTRVTSRPSPPSKASRSDVMSVCYCPNDPVTRGQMASFIDRAFDLPNTGTDYFDDDTGSTHEDAINRVAAAGITFGCSASDPTLFCPDNIVTRGQMASFIDRAIELPATAIDFFTDDDGITHEAAINRIANDGITLGCFAPDPTLFCPNATVTRGQMASFLGRALDLEEIFP